jgi:four helix bundle protein
MNEEEMKRRMREFGLRIIRLVQALPKGKVADVLGGQLLRSGTSPGANYRAACRARSTADFIAKLAIVEEELDESIYWMGMLADAGLMRLDRMKHLIKEADEWLAITVSSIKTAKRGRNKPCQSKI